MKHFKRFAGVCAALTLALSMTIGAFAAPSPSVDGVVTGGAGTDENGNAVTVTIEEVTDQTALDLLKDTEVVKAVLGADFSEDMVVADIKEISVPEGTTFPVTLTFDVSGVTDSTKVVVLHYNGSEWEKIDGAKAGNGTVTATFTSLSPVAFVIDGGTTAAGNGATSPKTGTSPVVMMAAFGAVICMAAAFGFAKKERA